MLAQFEDMVQQNLH